MQIRQDRVRQAVNLNLAFSPPITTFLAFARGTSFEEATDSGIAEPLIVPADYAFIIWSLIYLGGIAFGVYQAFPSQRNNTLLRRMDLYPAFAFLGTLPPGDHGAWQRWRRSVASAANSPRA